MMRREVRIVKAFKLVLMNTHNYLNIDYNPNAT